MKVMIACEFSGVVRDAFTARGHEAWSCDLLPSETNGIHVENDIRRFKPLQQFGLLVAFPPCTHLCASGARWFKHKKQEQTEAIDFFMWLANAPVKRIAIENSIGIMSTRWRKPDQIIQPWQFGHGETKATCLWLKGLPKLTPTNIVAGREARVHRLSPSPTRWMERSRTLQGIADAMATQWG